MPEQYIEALVADQATWLDGHAPVAIRWNAPDALGTAVNVTYAFLSAGSDSLDPHISAGDKTGYQPFTPEQTTVARAVLQMYSSIGNITFTEIDDPTGASAKILFGQNTQSGSTGLGYFPIYNGGATGGDVWFAANAPSNVNLDPGESGFFTLTHEVGHALGLQHAFGPDDGDPNTNDDNVFATPPLAPQTQNTKYSVMSYTSNPKNVFLDITDGLAPQDIHFSDFHYSAIGASTPMLYDVAAIQYLYGANTTRGAGDTTYTFDPHAPFFQCIWDAGGIDTISVANFTLGCEIDLRPGQFSNIMIPSDPIPQGWSATLPTYDGTENLSIAFGAIIERATGGAGNDTLTGNDARNVLSGGAGNDRLDGGASGGNFVSRLGNSLTGGTGDDFYTVNVTDRIWEAPDEGNDTVQTAQSYRLGANLENLVLTGSARASGTGNDLANDISGNAGANSLNGGQGADTLTGGGGADRFVFDTSLSSADADTIADFDWLDKIWLDEDVYSAFGQTDTTRVLATANFWTGAAAHDADDRVIYDSADGALRYDADGTGVGASVLIATLGTSFHPQLTFADFQIIA
jgi:Ca2+-binding RTX toxin-like protein